MNFRTLKITRVIISLVFFLLITFVFIDFTNALAGNIIQGILYLQLLPSLLNFFGTINIMVMVSSNDMETGEVIAIFSLVSFPPKI